MANGFSPMIAAANPHAAEAGLAMMRAGGSAVDAAIATQMVLGLVEPESSGIGGGAFMLVYNPKTKRTTSFDGREMAPAKTAGRKVSNAFSGVSFGSLSGASP